MSKNQEIELKATIRPELLDRVKDLPVIKKHAVGRMKTRTLRTIYFDTPDHALRRQGLSLRVRKVGHAYVQCVKQAHRRLGGILVRTEWEGPVPSQDPAISVIDNKTLRRRIKRAGVKDLRPLFRTDFQRRSRSIQFDDGGTATLDIDFGKIVAGDVSEPICEFELELASGAPEQLFDLASHIRKAVPFTLGNMSKASRGYALLTRDDPKPQKYVKLNLSENATVEQVLTKLVQHCLDHLRANETVVLKTADTEGVHQMRVALRRLRAALRLFKSTLPVDQYDWVVAEAKWLTAELSAARAWDVFADEFVAPVAQLYGKEQGFDALVAAVEQTKDNSRQRARKALETERYTEFLLHLSAWLSGQAWREQPFSEQTTRLLDPIGGHCAGLLKKRDRIVRKQGQNIENLSEIELHELRLSVRKLRYAVDFFESLYAKKRVRGYRKRLSKLQDDLGYLNDVAAADTLVRELGTEDGDGAAATWAHAGGIVVGWHRHATTAVRQQLAKDMAAFLQTEPFWRDV